MKKCEKVLKITVPQVTKFELSPYDDGGYHVEIHIGDGCGLDISFEIAECSECSNLLHCMANRNFFYVVILTSADSKIVTDPSKVMSYL